MNIREAIECAIHEAKDACKTEVKVQSLTIQMRETLDLAGHAVVRAEAIDVTIVPVRPATSVSFPGIP